MRRAVLAGLVLVAAGDLAYADGPLHGFGAPGAAPAAPWHVVGLPRQTKPFTKFSVAELDGHRALKVEADSSYGNLVHPLQLEHAAGHLAWQWRVDELNDKADIRARDTEDIALKVCTLWDMPIEQVPFIERQLLKVLRGRSADPVPAATVCYVWDANQPTGTQLDSPFTRRLRYIVLESGAAHLRHWTPEQRDIAADFMALFGDEAHGTLPPLIGVAVGADTDNTHAHSVAYTADVTLAP